MSVGSRAAEQPAGCGACAACGPKNLERLGVTTAGADFIVALAGNPNTGKSTIFNALTGLRQHVGNWAGKTVARAEGAFRVNNHRFKLVDLPGTYSLLSTSADEQVARDFILFGQPNVTIVVLDATRLERNLNLALQILEITDRVVVALNLMDEARRHGLSVDTRSLSRDLGVPVIPMAARRGEGVPELLAAVEDMATGRWQATARTSGQASPELEAAIATLVSELRDLFPNLPNARWVALRLLEGDESVVSAVRDGTLGEIAPAGHPATLTMLPQEVLDDVTA
jgi:ferrous iron transport protein B